MHETFSYQVEFGSIAGTHHPAIGLTRSRLRRCGWRSATRAPRSTPPSAGWASSRLLRARRAGEKINEYRLRVIQSGEAGRHALRERVSRPPPTFLHSCHEDEKYGVSGQEARQHLQLPGTQLISTLESSPRPVLPSLGLSSGLRRAATGPDANEQQTEGMAMAIPRASSAPSRKGNRCVDCITFILNATSRAAGPVMASLILFARKSCRGRQEAGECSAAAE